MERMSSFFCPSKIAGERAIESRSNREAYMQSSRLLLRRSQMSAAVLLIAALVFIRANRTFLAEADGLQAIVRYAELNQEFLHSQGAPVAQSQIVLFRSTLIAMTLNDDGEGRIGRQNSLDHLRVLGQRIAAVSPNIVLVVIEVHVLRFSRKRLRSGNGRAN